MKLTFCGAAGAVTGSNFLLEADGKKILIDCGMSQGSHYADEQNYKEFIYEPREIDAVFVTHAHIDHTGRLPKLVRDGFAGKIYSTPPTRDFSELLLLDSEHLLHHEAERQHVAPLYDASDVRATMKFWREAEYHEEMHVGDVRVTFLNAGHILGSAIVKVEAEGKTVIFSGDLGNYPPSIIRTTEFIDHADYCVVDSTYGDRVHENVKEREEQVEDAVEEAVKRGGVLLIPAFAMERTQDLLYYFNHLVNQHRIPRIPIFIDSPLAIKLTAVYKKYENYFDRAADAQVKSGDDIFNFPGLHLALTSEQSKEINHVPPPKIVIAGSGMSNGGRILHHELRYLSDPRSTILLTGFQARGTLGRAIQEGAESVFIMGEEVPVRCERRTLTGFSAHADQPRIVKWIEPMRRSLKTVFAVHGEPESSAALAQKLRDELAINAIVPGSGESHVL
jgi:metallo-beta-lactamase family protein